MLTPGSNMSLSDVVGPLSVIVTHSTGHDIDLTAFLLGTDGSVLGDDDMVFYNQNLRTGQGVTWHTPSTDGGTTTQRLSIDPGKLPSGYDTVRIALTVSEGTFGGVVAMAATVTDARGAVVAEFDLSRRHTENAFIVGEIYRRPIGEFKVRCVAAGFTDGLAGLARDAGISIDDEPGAPASAPAAAMAPPTQAPSLIKQLAATPPAAGASAVDLRKHKIAVVLVKNDMGDVVYRVVLLIDASGSMYALYNEPLGSRAATSKRGFLGFGSRTPVAEQAKSVVQRSFERMVPIADLLDDNHEMEVWFFGTVPSASESVTIATMDGYIRRNWAAKEAAGGSNDESAAMDAVMDWVHDNPSPYPTLVLAWSDGGVGQPKEIKKRLVRYSTEPVFWMWLGLGRANYGILEKLDKVTGGAVDNCGFIEIDDIDKMTDDDLYGKIFEIVGKWHREATAAGIIRR